VPLARAPGGGESIVAAARGTRSGLSGKSL